MKTGDVGESSLKNSILLTVFFGYLKHMSLSNADI